MVNELIYQSWFWWTIIEYMYSWSQLLNLRIINRDIKKITDNKLIHYHVVKLIAKKIFIQTKKCDNCGKLGKNSFHILSYHEFKYPNRVIILCNNWKCRYSGIVTYHYDFKEINKYICYKRLPIKFKEYITRTNNSKTLCYTNPFFVKKINNKWYIYCYWDTNKNYYYKYVPIEYFNIYKLDSYFLDFVYNNKFIDENIPILKLFEKEW